jgi:alpha-glucosidase (family GH31 glycosyl hydrolase)
MEMFEIKQDFYLGGWFIYKMHDDKSGVYKWSNMRFPRKKHAVEYLKSMIDAKE